MSEDTIARKLNFADNPDPETEKEPIRPGKHVHRQGVCSKSTSPPLARSTTGKKIQLTFFDIGILDEKFRPMDKKARRNGMNK